MAVLRGVNGQVQCLSREGHHRDRVEATISAKEEYMICRKALSEVILKRPELEGADLKRILHAREEGLKLLKANLQ
jgi:uncharacterized protein YjbI with pentapeptide repeats